MEDWQHHDLLPRAHGVERGLWFQCRPRGIEHPGQGIGPNPERRNGGIGPQPLSVGRDGDGIHLVPGGVNGLQDVGRGHPGHVVLS